MAAANTIIIKDVFIEGQVTGTYTCASSTGATYVPCGFAPSVVMGWNVTDKDQWFLWSEGMGAGTAINMGAAAVAVATGGITAVAGETGEISTGDNTHARPARGFLLGVDLGIQEASKVFDFIAFR
jgi:hypothetical protein